MIYASSHSSSTIELSMIFPNSPRRLGTEGASGGHSGDQRKNGDLGEDLGLGGKAPENVQL
jgi:hypothetical protein